MTRLKPARQPEKRELSLLLECCRAPRRGVNSFRVESPGRLWGLGDKGEIIERRWGVRVEESDSARSRNHVSGNAFTLQKESPWNWKTIVFRPGETLQRFWWGGLTERGQVFHRRSGTRPDLSGRIEGGIFDLAIKVHCSGKLVLRNYSLHSRFLKPPSERITEAVECMQGGFEHV